MNGRDQWRLEMDEHQVGWLHFDTPDAAVNTLSRRALEQLNEIIGEIEQGSLKGVVILSDKRGGFIAGADVREFTSINRESEAEELMSHARGVFARLEGLSIPTVAMIHGHCLGGGLELALACRYRVAREEASLGFPEVLLGIFPGFGGSVRSIRRVGILTAMTMMLSGRPLHAKRAAKVGLVDAAVPGRQLRRAVLHFIEHQPKQRRPSIGVRLLEMAPLRPLVAAQLKRKTAERVNPDHYPAPFTLIDLWKKHGGNSEEMFRREGESVSSLLVGATAQNLVRVFFLQERMKSFGKRAPKSVGHLHVIGAGVMGGDIAAWCALQGIQVTLQDRHLEPVAAVIARAERLFRKKLHNPRDRQAALDRLIPDLDGEGIRTADIVLEVIIEDLDIKRALYREIEPRMRPDAILATNTSSIPIDQLAEGLSRPERIVGIHFFNPVAKMKLVEVVAGSISSDKSLQGAAGFVTQIRRLPLPVKSSPGFLVNRILMPYLMESVQMVGEGITPDEIDRIALEFGMPMGPIELADTVGLDVCVAVARELSEVTGDKVPSQLLQWVEEGRLGRKSGHGFYRYKKGQRVDKRDNGGSSGESALILDRMVLRIVNEALRCLDEGVVESGDLLDAGMVFGTGFAPFRGGVIQYIRQRGKENIEKRLLELEQTLGDRFQRVPGWDQV